MSTSQHPIALRLEHHVGDAARLLATVMCLPLVDGIFPALVLAGALSDPAGIVEVGLLVFGGSATLAVILAEMDGQPRDQARVVLAVGAVLVSGAAVEAALAPTIQSALDLAVFERFAALVVAAIAAKTASARVGELLPRPAVIVGLGLVASARPAQAELAIAADPGLVARAVAAALVGTAFALAVALTGPRLRASVDIDRFRFGSAVALGLLTLSILGFSFHGAPLAVVAVTGLLAFDPGDGPGADPESDAARGADGGAATPDSATAAVADGGRSGGDPARWRDEEADATPDADDAIRTSGGEDTGATGSTGDDTGATGSGGEDLVNPTWTWPSAHAHGKSIVDGPHGDDENQ